MPLGREYERKLSFNRLVVFMNANAEEVNRFRVDRGARVGFVMGRLKDLFGRLGFYVDVNHLYMAYALALLKTQDRLRFMVDFIREHQVLRDRFERRNLRSDVLDEIDRLIIYRKGDV
jgi:hypothetical protein